jgi:hypothetical protein
VAPGGTTGQVLNKVSATNYDTAWVTPAAGSASPWTDAAGLAYLTDQTEGIAVGSTTLPTGARAYVKYGTGTVNGEWYPARAPPWPPTSGGRPHGRGDRRRGAHAPVTSATPIFLLGAPTGNAFFNCIGVSTTGMAHPEGLVQEWFETSLSAAQQVYFPYCKGRWDGNFPVNTGASTAGMFTVKQLDWLWPTGNTNRRHYRFRFRGLITRAAGDTGMKVSFGSNSAQTLVFDWASGTVTWATAHFDLEVSIFADTGVGNGDAEVTSKLNLIVDHTNPTANVAITYMAVSPWLTAIAKTGIRLLVQGVFSVSNASNNIALRGFQVQGQKVSA